MNYINCPSYSSLFFVLHLKNNNKNVTVITNNNSIKKYCEYANIKYIFFKNINFGLRNIWRIISYKKQINSLISNINIGKYDNFYLLDNSFTIEGFYIAKEWSKKGKVYFNDLENFKLKRNKLSPSIFNRKFMKIIFIKYIYQLFMGINLDIYDNGSIIFFGISDEFLEKNKIFKINIKNNLIELKKEVIKNNTIKLKKYNNLIFDQGDCLGFTKNNSVYNLYKKLLACNFNYVIKEHPFHKFHKFHDKCPKYPDYYPAEFLLNNITKNVISISSSALILASSIDNLHAISLLELVDWKERKYQIKTREWLKRESGNKIIFVKSLPELLQYL